MNAKRLLILSLVLNLGLAGAAAWLAKKRSTSVAVPNTIQTATKSDLANPKASTEPKPPPNPTVADPAKPTQSFDWRMVESEDYKKYIANLRAIGCPEETIRDIIIADVNKLFASRKRAASVSTN